MDAPKRTKVFAKSLRRRMTLPEVLLWRQLRARQQGLRFRRQHPVGPYVLDFYCDAAGLAVEVDGGGHGFGDRPDEDARRDAYLARHGIRTVRLSAKYVLDDVDAAVRTVVAACAERSRGAS
ncbi:MAG TPA: endonuclease domain-containing protein [Phenylobacterium sp.]